MALTRVEINRRYRERHGDAYRQRERESAARRRTAMTEEHLAVYRARRAEDMSRFRASNPDYWRKYQAANRSTYRARSRAWRQANPEKAAEATRRWRAENWPKVLASLQRRRARRRGAPGTATLDQIRARFDYYGGRCWMCGAEASCLDHVKALCNGGSHWPANLRPACGPCNSKKGQMEMRMTIRLSEFVAKLKARDFPREADA